MVLALPRARVLPFIRKRTAFCEIPLQAGDPTGERENGQTEKGIE